jgi:hypothetical protein
MFFHEETPINWLMSRRAQEDPETKQCPECDSAIPVKARRCPECTTRLIAPADAPPRPGSTPPPRPGSTPPPRPGSAPAA